MTVQLMKKAFSPLLLLGPLHACSFGLLHPGSASVVGPPPPNTTEMNEILFGLFAAFKKCKKIQHSNFNWNYFLLKKSVLWIIQSNLEADFWKHAANNRTAVKPHLHCSWMSQKANITLDSGILWWPFFRIVATFIN